MATVNCPHCGEMNVDAGQFCASCGKALPSVDAAGPQVVTGNMVAQTDAGRTVQVEQLRKQAGQAFGALLAVAIIMSVFGIIIYFLLKNAQNPDAQKAAGSVLAVNLILGAIFAGLAAWSRSNPLPAAIVGLVLFVSVFAYEAIMNPVSIVQGIIVKVVVIVVLVKAIQAGNKYRQLKEEGVG